MSGNNKPIFSTLTVDQEFRKQLYEKLAERQNDEVQLITEHRLDELDYAERVGYLRALKEIREDITQLLEAFFPTT